MEKLTEMPAEDLKYWKAVENLMRGCDLLKLRPRRKYKRSFFLESDHESIVYRAPLGMGLCIGKASKCIDIGTVREIRGPGYATDIFNRKEKSSSFCSKYPAENCFSLVMANGKTVDLIASDRDTCEMWIHVTRRLVDQAQQSKREERLEKWLKKQFKAADISGDGFLNFEECILLLSKLNIDFSGDQAASFFKKAGPWTRKDRSEVLDSDGFRRFFRLLSDRPELREIFLRFSEKSDAFWTLQSLHNFLIQQQKECEGRREFAGDFAETCRWLVSTFEPVQENKTQNLLSLAGFRNFMLSSRQMIFQPKCLTVYQDMTQPLQHYFIASSHNTYLLDRQVMGTSSIEGYISTVLTGCRCIELDCWDGPDGEPMITHGFTMSSSMDFKHAVTVLRDYGFKTSEYPLIVSLENHCCIEQQRKMADYLRGILKERLFTAQTDTIKRQNLPSPEELRGFVFLVAKKLPNGIGNDTEFYAAAVGDATEEPTAWNGLNGDCVDVNGEGFRCIDMSKGESDLKVRKKIKVAKALSDCVFLREVQFRGFVVSKDDGEFHNVDNIAELKMLTLVQQSRQEFVQHTQQHLVRIYPDGLRTDSSNMNPILAMASGCQIVAFNYQSKSKETQVYRALFANNGGCGYLLKPQYMRHNPVNLGAFDEAKKHLRLKVNIISAQQLPKLPGSGDKNISNPYVMVEIFGSETDMKTFSTKSIGNNGFNPVWNEEFTFTLQDQDLAVLRFEVRDMDLRVRDLMGQYSIAVTCVQEGYRHVQLVDAQEQLLDLTTLFVHIQKEIIP